MDLDDNGLLLKSVRPAVESGALKCTHMFDHRPQSEPWRDAKISWPYFNDSLATYQLPMGEPAAGTDVGIDLGRAFQKITPLVSTSNSRVPVCVTPVVTDGAAPTTN